MRTLADIAQLSVGFYVGCSATRMFHHRTNNEGDSMTDRTVSMWDWPRDGGRPMQVRTIGSRDALAAAWWALTADPAQIVDAALTDAPAAAAESLAELVGSAIAIRCPDEHAPAAWDAIDEALERAQGAENASVAVLLVAGAVRSAVGGDALETITATLRRDLLAMAGQQ